MKNVILATTILAGSAIAASAAPITFFGENLSPGATVTGDPVTAQAAFLSTLAGGVGTEDFESGGLNLTFPGSSGNISATLSGGNTSVQSGPLAGRFATSGSNYVNTGSGGDFNIAFGSAISAFGFYGTDIGDFANSLSLRLTLSGGGTVDLNVPNTVSSGGNNSGSLLFFGFIDTVNTYTNISFFNQPTGDDVFGFDDMIIGDAAQIVNPPPATVPLPASILLLGAGIAGMGAMRKRKKS